MSDDDPVLQKFMHPRVDHPEDFEPDDANEVLPGDAEDEEDDPPKKTWEDRAVIYLLNGKPVPLYPVGAMAEALHRKSVTIRSWEHKGWFPRTFITGPVQARGRRRLYTREMIEGAREIARDEGLFVEPQKAPKMESTNFPERVHRLFAEIRQIYGLEEE